jgi:hypothetical protein
MNTFTSFDGIRIAYHDQDGVRANLDLRLETAADTSIFPDAGRVILR